MRRALLSHPDQQGTLQTSLAARLALHYLAQQGLTPQPTDSGAVTLGTTTIIPFRKRDGAYASVSGGGYQMLMRYRGHVEAFPQVSALEVLNGEVEGSVVRDRIVIQWNEQPDAFRIRHEFAVFDDGEAARGIV